MNKSTRVARFRRSVYRHPTISTGCKVLLLRLSEDMSAEGRVSIPRSKLVEELNVRPASITAWTKQAKAAGFIQTVKRGRPGTTAVYALLTVLGTQSVPTLGTENLSNPGVRSAYQEEGTNRAAWYGKTDCQEKRPAVDVQTVPDWLPDEAATG